MKPFLSSQIQTLSMEESKSPQNDTAESQNDTLIPGLPDDLARRCISCLPPALIFSVSRPWRRFLYSPSLRPLFSLYALLSPTNPVSNNTLHFSSFDPLLSSWQPLPPQPPLHLLHRHPSFLSRTLPIQSLTVSNHLVLIAGTSPQFAPGLPSPIIFQPESNRWFLGPAIPVPRRWCAAGSVNGAVYVASGVGSNYRGDVARSTEKWDMKENMENWRWEKKSQLQDGRFSREAVEAVGYRGKLCMVNVKGNAVKQGAVYDVALDQWGEMPEGMVAGWSGVAATMEEREIYVVDEVKGRLSWYDDAGDCWVKVVELEQLRRAEQLAAGKGRVCAVCERGERIVVVDVAGQVARSWEVAPPPGMEVVAVHVLPRMVS